MTVETALLDVGGPAAPPRRNGELVFAEPWESRAFGVALALHAAGSFQWEAFRRQLMAAIAQWEAGNPEGGDFTYYRCWLQALETVLVAEGLIAPGELDERAAELAARPAGHDHGHAHAHEHAYGR
jgi:nitrile hydratase accessory protein